VAQSLPQSHLLDPLLSEHLWNCGSNRIHNRIDNSRNQREREEEDRRVDGLGGGGIAFAGVLIIAVPRRRKLWLPMFCFVALGAALLTIGCSAGGGSIGPGGGSSGTPAGTYTFTITGANGSISGSTTQTVTVQ
jgi:hypothetical protein